VGSAIQDADRAIPPALLYHKVSTKLDLGVTVILPSMFRNQMMRIHRAGWRTIVLDDLLNTDLNHLPEKSFFLTFDDGYECIYDYAFPIMEEFGFKGNIFIPSGKIGGRNDWDYHFLGTWYNHLNSQQIKELIAAGWQIGGHGVDHKAMTMLSDEEVSQQLAQSRDDLENEFGIKVNWFSFPFGRYNDKIVDKTCESGYRGAIILSNGQPIESAKLLTVLVDAVYLFDLAVFVQRRLSRNGLYWLGSRFRKSLNWCSGGTILWNKWFRSEKKR